MARCYIQSLRGGFNSIGPAIVASLVSVAVAAVVAAMATTSLGGVRIPLPILVPFLPCQYFNNKVLETS